MKYIIGIMLALLSAGSMAASPDPVDLIRKAMDHWRGVTSYGEMTMVIHRPDWERSMSMEAWTEGDKLSLVRVTAPARDAGNGSLVVELCPENQSGNQGPLFDDEPKLDGFRLVEQGHQ